MTSQPNLNRLSPPPINAISAALKVANVSVDWLAGDGSDRCYYRIRSHEPNKSYVLMQLSGSDAEALRAGRYDWIHIAEILTKHGITVPRPIALMKDNAAIVIDDYGDTMLESFTLNSLKSDQTANVSKAYARCFDVLGKFLTFTPSNDAPWCQRSFDAERFSWELNFFSKKFLQGVLNWTLGGEDLEKFNSDVTKLSEYLATLSKYFVHRDFHSRNVMVVNDKVAVIDFQDARLGPASYDLVSLCFDSYIPFSASDRRALMMEGSGVITKIAGEKIGKEIFDQWKPVLLQRQIKAIGSFGYLTVDKNKGDYLKNVSPALRTLEEQDLKDNRWPFLSDTMLKKMRELWTKR